MFVNRLWASAALVTMQVMDLRMKTWRPIRVFMGLVAAWEPALAWLNVGIAPSAMGAKCRFEPPRVFRRQFILSQATLADSSSWR